MAADIAQKPPSATPSTTRASSSMESDEAKVARRFDRIRNDVSIHITSLRSMRRVMMAMVGAAMAPTIAVPEMLARNPPRFATLLGVDDPTLRLESFKAQRTGYSFC